jgi:hypothetical protein
VKKLVKIASVIQKRVFSPGLFTDYLLLLILATLPMILAKCIGIARTQKVNLGASQALCWGYWDRNNWISLIVLLPTALWTARVISDLLFHQTKRFARFKRIPDLVPGNGASAQEFDDAFSDGRNLLGAFFLTICVQVIDMWDTLVPYARSIHRTHPISSAPYRWDWALWFLSQPADRSLYWKDMGLVLIAYSSQFGMTLFAISAVILLLRHNIFYLRSIYLRSRAASNRPMIPLDFEAADLCFGFHSLFMVFNVQLFILGVAGAYTLASRASNSDTSAMSTCLSKLTEGEFKFSEFWGAVFGNLTPLFPTVGQRIFPVVWMAMFAIVLLPALVKLLPVSGILGQSGMDAKDYLLQFLPPDSKIAVDTQDLKEKADVDATASKFSQQSFWPVGQTSAELFSIAAFFIFFLILAPVFTSHLSVGHFLFYGLLLAMSFACSLSLFAAFRYMLRSIDRRLVEKEHS